MPASLSFYRGNLNLLNLFDSKFLLHHDATWQEKNKIIIYKETKILTCFCLEISESIKYRFSLTPSRWISYNKKNLKKI